MSQPRPGYLLPPKATILALSGVLLGMLLAALNQTIVATALPKITLGIPLMVVALALVLLIPEQPLRRHVREPEATPVAA